MYAPEPYLNSRSYKYIPLLYDMSFNSDYSSFSNNDFRGVHIVIKIIFTPKENNPTTPKICESVCEWLYSFKKGEKLFYDFKSPNIPFLNFVQEQEVFNSYIIDLCYSEYITLLDKVIKNNITYQ
jgi:hypothetical protein